MAKVIYGMGVSLDGYVEDAHGNFSWAAPSEDLHRLANQQAEEASAFLYGRRLYELMETYWPTAREREELSEVEAEFARIYVQTPRIVFSDTLESVGEGATLVRSADAVGEVARLKQESEGDLDLGGPGLAASLFDLIDEFRLWVNPVIVGSGRRFFPPLAENSKLELSENRTLSSGVVYLRYERLR